MTKTLHEEIHEVCCHDCKKAVPGRLGGRSPCEHYPKCDVYAEEFAEIKQDWELEMELMTEDG